MPFKPKSEAPAETPTTEVVLKDNTTIQVREANPAEVAAFLTGKDSATGADLVQNEDPADAVRSIITNIMAGQSAEDIFGAGSVVHARDMLDEPFTFRNVKWIKSAFEESPMPMFGVYDIVTANGEQRTMTCGGAAVMAAVYAAQKRGVLSDVQVKIVGKTTGRGYQALNVVLAAS